MGCRLDLIQAGDNAAAEDVDGFRPHFGDEVAQFAGIGHGLLVGGLRHVDLLDQRFLDRGAGRLDGQKILDLLDRLPGDLALVPHDSLQTLHDRLVGGAQRLDVAALDVQNRGDVKTVRSTAGHASVPYSLVPSVPYARETATRCLECAG